MNSKSGFNCQSWRDRLSHHEHRQAVGFEVRGRLLRGRCQIQTRRNGGRGGPFGTSRILAVLLETGQDH